MMTIDEMKTINKLDVMSLVRAYAKLAVENDRAEDAVEVLSAILVFLSVALLLPCYALSVVFSLAYPVIRFATTPWDDQTLLQQLFSCMYIVLVPKFNFSFPFK